MSKIAWIGLGSMGGAMARNLLKAGHDLVVYDLDQSKCDAMVGAEKAASCAQAARHAEFIFFSVPDPAALISCVFDESGVLSVLHEGQSVIDMSTVSIEVSAQCDEAICEKNGTFLCTPVAGGADMAQAAQITVMCSGAKDAYEKALPLFQCLSKSQYYLGEGYCARAMKLAHNMMIAVNMQMFAETLAFCEKAGVDPDVAMDIISESAVSNAYLSFKMPEIRERTFKRTSMPIWMLAKDLCLAMACADRMGASTPLTEHTKGILDELAQQGYDDKDPSWLVLQMEKEAGLDPKEMK